MRRLTLLLLLVFSSAAQAVDFTPIGGGFSSSQIDTSAELATIVGDETGSGALVFGTSPTFTGGATITGGTVTTSAPLISGTQTWNAAGVPFTASLLNVTNTASAAASLLADWQLNSASVCRVRKDGSIGIGPTAENIWLAYSGGYILDVLANNTSYLQIHGGSGTVTVGSAAIATMAIGQTDCKLARDAANTLALRNGGNPQTLNIYNTYTDVNNYACLKMTNVSSYQIIDCAINGTGTTNGLLIRSAGNNHLAIGTSGPISGSWAITSSKHLLAGTNNTYDIGGGADYNPRHVYASTSMQVISNTGYIGIGANSPDVFLYREAANTLALRNGTAAQNFRAYNIDSGANDEYLQTGFTSNVARIETVKTGTGTQRDMLLGAPTITLSGEASVAGNITQTAGTDRKVTINRTAATDYARLTFQTGGTEMWAFGPRGDNGGSGINNTLSLTGNAGDSYPVVLNVIPGGANYTLEVGAAHKLKASGKFSHGTAGALTIATGAITVTKGYHAVDTESAAATDDLDTISGGAEGDRVVIRAANAARTVVVKDGTGNLKLAGDCTLDNSEDTIELIHDGTNWLEVCRSNNGA